MVGRGFYLFFYVVVFSEGGVGVGVAVVVVFVEEKFGWRFSRSLDGLEALKGK